MVDPQERSPARRPGPFAAAALVLSIGLAGALPAAAQTIRHVETEVRLSERLLAGDLERHRAAREREETARRRLAAALSALDQALTASPATPLERLEELETAAAAARATWSAAADRAGELRAAIYAHRRRLAALGEELGTRRSTPELPDPISGAWRLELAPGEIAGLLDLNLDGTVLGGRLGLDDGTVGSVRGTFVDGALRVERVSAGGGLDLVLEGRFDPATGELAGTWQPTVLGRGEPAGGTWAAVKAAGDDE